MARSLGTFGAAVTEAEEKSERVTFLLGPAGEEFYADTEIGFIPFGKFAHAASSGLDTAQMDGVAAVMDMMRECVGANHDPDTDKARTKDQEWARFLESATRQKISADVILELVTAVFGGASGKAEQPPSGSQAGQFQTPTGMKSNANSTGSVSPGTLKPVFEPVTDDVLADLGG